MSNKSLDVQLEGPERLPAAVFSGRGRQQPLKQGLRFGRAERVDVDRLRLAEFRQCGQAAGQGDEVTAEESVGSGQRRKVFFVAGRVQEHFADLLSRDSVEQEGFAVAACGLPVAERGDDGVDDPETAAAFSQLAQRGAAADLVIPEAELVERGDFAAGIERDDRRKL